MPEESNFDSNKENESKKNFTQYLISQEGGFKDSMYALIVCSNHYAFLDIKKFLLNCKEFYEKNTDKALQLNPVQLADATVEWLKENKKLEKQLVPSSPKFKANSKFKPEDKSEKNLNTTFEQNPDYVPNPDIVESKSIVKIVRNFLKLR